MADLNVADVRTLVEEAVEQCRAQPNISVADALVAMACARDVDPSGCVYVAYHFNFHRGGHHSDFEFMSKATWKIFKCKYVNTTKEIDFGEINGKHSQVLRAWHEVDHTIVRRGWRADETADVAIARLLLCGDVDCGDLADIVAHLEDSDAESSSDDASNKRAECDDVEVPAAKRAASSVD